jgi:hypothetical protein
MWEAMVAELRAVRAEADHRRHFTEDKKPIELVRDQLAGWTSITEDPAFVAERSAGRMRDAARDDLFELG